MAMTLGFVKGILSRFLDVLFRCPHKNFSFPITCKPGQRLTPASQITGTYVACIECGKEFAYDWKDMRVLWQTKMK